MYFGIANFEATRHTFFRGVRLEAADIAETLDPLVHVHLAASGQEVGPVPALVLGPQGKEMLVVSRVECGQDLLTLVQIYASQLFALLGVILVKVVKHM